MRRTALRAIKAKCLECSGGVRKEVGQCPIEECPLWAYREGRDMNKVRHGAMPPNGRPFPKTRGQTCQFSQQVPLKVSEHQEAACVDPGASWSVIEGKGVAHE